MKKYFLPALIIGAVAISFLKVDALVCSLPSQGGTGICSATSSDVGKVLTVSSSSPFGYTLGTVFVPATTTIAGLTSATFNIFATTTLGVTTSSPNNIYIGPGSLNISQWTNDVGYVTSSGARAAFSTDVTGLSYSPSTGVLSTSTGYTIPFLASTTAWQAFYDTPSTRITAGTNMTWNGNQLDGKSDSSIRSLFSAGTGIQYSTSTGVITNGGVQSLAAGAGVTVSSATGTVTVANAAPHVTSTISAGGGTATGNAFTFATSGPLMSILCGISSCTFTTLATSSLGLVTAVTGSGNIASSGGTTPNITFTGVLPYANGGTATSTTFVQGSMIFAGPSGFAQNNPKLFFDNASTTLMVGTSTMSTYFISGATQEAPFYAASTADLNTQIGVQNSNATGLNAAAIIRTAADTARINFQSHGSARTVSRWGVALGGWNELLGVTQLGFAFGNLGDFPLIIGKDSINRFEMASSTDETIFNKPQNDWDFRVAGQTNANLIVGDASTNRVGIGTSTPANILHIVDGTATTSVAIGSSAIGTNRGRLCLWNGASYTIQSFAANSITPIYATSTTC